MHVLATVHFSQDRQDVGFCEQDGRPRGYGNEIALAGKNKD